MLRAGVGELVGLDPEVTRATPAAELLRRLAVLVSDGRVAQDAQTRAAHLSNEMRLLQLALKEAEQEREQERAGWELQLERTRMAWEEERQQGAVLKVDLEQMRTVFKEQVQENAALNRRLQALKMKATPRKRHGAAEEEQSK